MTSEITNQSIALQEKWLLHLQTDMQNLNPNKIAMIKGYLEKTGLHTRMISVFEKMRAHLKKDYSESVNQKFTNACKDFNSYLTMRITWLTKPDKSNPSDPWYRLGLSSGEKELIETSFHLQDLLKDIELILTHEIDEGCEIASDEIQELLKMISKNLPKLKSKQSFIEKFKELNAEITNKNFETAKELFSHISKLLME